MSEVSWLRMEHCHVGPQKGWLHVGSDGNKPCDIDLLNQTREPLYDYLQATRNTERTYVFRSKREGRLTEQGIHYWFRTLKAQASSDQGVVIQDLTFHDLRTDLAHRVREAGWSFQEVANYLGHVIQNGAPPTF